MDNNAEATLVRKRPDQKRRTLVMRGRIEQLIRYVLSTPEAIRREYKLVCGRSEYGMGRIEAVARQFGIDVSDEKIASSETAAKPLKSKKRKFG